VEYLINTLDTSCIFKRIRFAGQWHFEVTSKARFESNWLKPKFQKQEVLADKQ